jgi:hypothetical protein
LFIKDSPLSGYEWGIYIKLCGEGLRAGRINRVILCPSRGCENGRCCHFSPQVGTVLGVWFRSLVCIIRQKNSPEIWGDIILILGRK